MIDLYYAPTPNGHKITLFLEEAELAYRLLKVDISKGNQFRPDFLAISPNNKIPAIVDHAPADGGQPLSLFESGEILLYLAEKAANCLAGSCVNAIPHCNGCSGRSAGWGRCWARTIILTTLRRRQSPMRLNAIRLKRNAYTTF